MMRKLVIANTGTGNRGKSTSIKEVYKLVTTRYPENIRIIHPLVSGDVKAIVEVQGVLVGIESQGDPKSRIFDSLEDFHAAGCGIIVIACRTHGDTFNAVDGMHQCGYQVIWTANDKNWDEDSVVDYLNSKYAEHVVRLIEDRINNKF